MMPCYHEFINIFSNMTNEAETFVGRIVLYLSVILTSYFESPTLVQCLKIWNQKIPFQDVKIPNVIGILDRKSVTNNVFTISLLSQYPPVSNWSNKPLISRDDNS